ncbi:DUF7373 family lipoprotein [Nocardia acidivorans]|uniref:DUF7373 family lipoprotein n=1 Tax=Nocardia acidivorans TaxID=404580 RepID=UPI000AE8478D
MKLHRVIRCGVLGLCAVLGAVGCGRVVAGAPVAGEVDIRGLDVGGYSVDPVDFRRVAVGDDGVGVELAIVRLAGGVPTGVEIEPRLGNELAGRAIRGSGDVDPLLRSIVERNGMMFGFGMAATAVPDTTRVRVTVLQFPEPGAARTAAIEAEAAGFGSAPKVSAPVTLDWYPDAKAHWRQDVPALDAALARGNYLIVVNVARPEPNLTVLQELTKRAIAAQLPLLDKLPPLTAREMRQQGYDPQDMLRRSLHAGEDLAPNFDQEAVFDARGFRHVAADSALWGRLLELGGIDAVARISGGGLVARARDDKAADAVLNEMRAGVRPADPPPGVPEAFCAETASATERFTCTVRSGRYVAQVASAQVRDAHQRAAAQFAVLVNSGWT